ncbi:helix-turn-helix transcriptional regulator [Myroides odoratimimus]|uniref:helix-turn-helix transcriptional regulator n=1 Tax=Myroides odoratimimus TaxID=76832 RepID=UPI003D2F1285
MSVNKNALIRYKSLDKCFSNKYKRYYLNDLIQECNDTLYEHYGEDVTVSRRQIFNDIAFMKSEAGYDAPITSVKDGRKVYYRYEDTNFSILQKPLTNDELSMIENIIELLSRLKGIPGVEGLESVETKLMNVSNENQIQKIISFQENEFLNGIDFLTPLYNYIKNHQVLDILYKPFKHVNSTSFTIAPYFLKQYNNRWFLFGLNYKIKKIQNIALDRIVDLEVSTSEIYLKNDIDFEEYFDDIVGVTNFEDSEVLNIKIQLSENIIPYIKSKPIHGSQRIIKDVLYLSVKYNYELESLILSYGENMKVLEPIHVKNNVIKRLNNAINKY